MSGIFGKRRKMGHSCAWLSSGTIIDILRDAQKDGNNKNTWLPGLKDSSTWLLYFIKDYSPFVIFYLYIYTHKDTTVYHTI